MNKIHDQSLRNKVERKNVHNFAHGAYYSKSMYMYSQSEFSHSRSFIINALNNYFSLIAASLNFIDEKVTTRAYARIYFGNMISTGLSEKRYLARSEFCAIFSRIFFKAWFCRCP